MLRGACSVMAVTATLLLVCHADPHQERDRNLNAADRYGENGQKSQIAEMGGNLIRQTRNTRPYLLRRSLSSNYMDAGYPLHINSGSSGLESYVNKRNFDEIDLSAMPFPYKRFYHLYGNNIDMPIANFDKKRLFRPEYPMDEIDLSYFPIGSKRRALDADLTENHSR